MVYLIAILAQSSKDRNKSMFKSSETPRIRRANLPELPASDAVSRIDAACRSIVDGKLAARDLANWVSALDVSETEFRLLWILQRASASPAVNASCLDQAALADQLAVSPAQVSGLVERLAATGYIEPHRLPSDRRRQLWQITLAGKLLLSNVMVQVDANAVYRTPAKEVA